ncbi:DUF4382 domain-containing protein [Halalkalirubrum salinum]|uniref:DUF4382 domain-containing protein n=1 Tax=Halalkalirubrum salinum TaxID=2563889 RepID=UPI0010FB57BF|nr:DUF4382 domain-containing protein [Halalkalirubrum salinum]
MTPFTDSSKLDRRTYLKTAGIAAIGTTALAGCSSAQAATGTLATRVTDQPGDISDFESCIVTIDGIWIKPASDETDDEDEIDNENGSDDQNETEESDTTANETDEADVDESDDRQYFEFDESQEADLVELQDGETDLIDEREIETGEYQFLQLDVSNVEGTLSDGESAEVDTPGNAPLQFKMPFEIREEQTTSFTGDFTPVRRGQTDRYLLQPVARGTAVSYEDESS